MLIGSNSSWFDFVDILLIFFYAVVVEESTEGKKVTVQDTGRPSKKPRKVTILKIIFLWILVAKNV